MGYSCQKMFNINLLGGLLSGLVYCFAICPVRLIASKCCYPIEKRIFQIFEKIEIFLSCQMAIFITESTLTNSQLIFILIKRHQKQPKKTDHNPIKPTNIRQYTINFPITPINNPMNRRRKYINIQQSTRIKIINNCSHSTLSNKMTFLLRLSLKR